MADDISARRDALDGRTGWLASGGLLAALLASSCCIAPLVLVLLGVSGAWIGNLTALEPFKRYFAAVALVFIAVGLWQVYFRTRPNCAEGSYCARPGSSTLVKTALWLSVVLIILALTLDWWAPYFY